MILKKSATLEQCVQNNTSWNGAENVAQQIANIFSKLSSHIRSSTPLYVLQVGF